jgi:hypothetical protein
VSFYPVRRRSVRVISKKRLREFWTSHADAQAELEAWHKLLGKQPGRNSRTFVGLTAKLTG